MIHENFHFQVVSKVKKRGGFYMNNTYAYQKKFVDRAIDLLDSKGRAAVILPTGVGKSYIAADVIRHYLKEDF